MWEQTPQPCHPAVGTMPKLAGKCQHDYPNVCCSANLNFGLMNKQSTIEFTTQNSIHNNPTALHHNLIFIETLFRAWKPHFQPASYCKWWQLRFLLVGFSPMLLDHHQSNWMDLFKKLDLFKKKSWENSFTFEMVYLLIKTWKCFFKLNFWIVTFLVMSTRQ